MQAAIDALGTPPHLDLLHEIFQYLELEYGGIRRDRIQKIQDFRKENDDIPKTMYTRLAQFAR